MKVKTLFTLLLAMTLTLASCAGKKDSGKAQDEPKIAVAYYSATGTTKAAAERLAKLSGGDLIEIVPAEIYTEQDLDWRDSLSRSSVEMRDLTARPEIAGDPISLEQYDIILIGFPNWWNTAPRIVNTFIEESVPEGKTAAPFMTSGGSNIIQSENDLKEAYPAIVWKQGLLMNEVTDEQISDWVEAVEQRQYKVN